ncbi:hypothetical protein E2R51_13080 [Jeotgalibacillus sp. S-D1]|uniref:hypothetical protein n=1 Tax=Jeotgalibacillus sp. S-D1 TaxID=2552189 RepID=UPI0010598CFB|nr:hypothetical protein [Jeotgalibacillus sp. S-D1]TDL31301.1 hypothetical protein E2R51_13080 [Jeotgalibacillus sp. S-D1]
MNQDPFKNDQFIKSKLDEYHVEIPDIPIRTKTKRWDRFISYLGSPAKNPIEPAVSTTNRLLLVKTVPLVGAAVLTLLQVLVLI